MYKFTFRFIFTFTEIGKQKDRQELDSLRWLSLRRSPTPHFWGCALPTGPWSPNSNSAEIFAQCTYLQVSSSCVYSFGSYRVDKQTNKQTPLKTPNAIRYANNDICMLKIQHKKATNSSSSSSSNTYPLTLSLTHNVSEAGVEYVMHVCQICNRVSATKTRTTRSVSCFLLGPPDVLDT